MSIIRVHKTANYTVMSNNHFKEKKMSLKAKGLLSLMLSLPDDWNYSIAGLVTLSKDGKDSVMAALAELEKFGYLNRLRITNSKGQFSGVEYNIFEQPQKDIPVADNQKAEDQKAAKADAEKPPQLNTKLTNNLNNKNNKELIPKDSTLGDYQDILKHIEDLELKNLYVDYIEMRIINGFPISQRGLSMLINRAARISNFDKAIEKQLLETAIINNWKNVYAPKEENKIIKDDKLDELKNFYGEN